MTAPAGGRWTTALGEVARLVAASARTTAAGFALCTLAASLIPVAIAWLTKAVLDHLAETGWSGRLALLGAALAAMVLTSSVLAQLAQYLRAELGRRTALSAEDRLFTTVAGFAGIGRFEDPAFLDRLRLAQQAASAPANLIEDLFIVAAGGMALVGFAVSLALITPVMVAVIAATAVPMLLLELQLSRRRAAMFWRISPIERREAFYRGLLDDAAAAKELRLFGLGAFFRDRMLVERRAANGQKRALDRREAIVQSGLAAAAACVAGAGLLWAIRSATTGALTVGDVAMFLAAVTGVQAALHALVQSIGQSHQQLLFLEHYVALLRSGPDLPVAQSPAAVGPLREGIEFRDVWFRYSDGHPWALSGVDMFIPHGSSVALVGWNGAGKSTIIKLLCRFYDPDKGAIYWDGVDIRAVDIGALRRRIGAVFQDFMEYDLTAAENIALGDLQALTDRPRVTAAARRAGVHEPINRLPRGYDTLLTRMFFGDEEEGTGAGVRLSGGQWQRLALARAFLRDDRDLMILDEPSAGLDADAEYELLTRLREQRIGRTSVQISHRLGSIRDSDLIVVLGAGTVLESGDHETLLASGGAYARLFRRQAEGYT